MSKKQKPASITYSAENAEKPGDRTDSHAYNVPKDGERLRSSVEFVFDSNFFVGLTGEEFEEQILPPLQETLEHVRPDSKGVDLIVHRRDDSSATHYVVEVKSGAEGSPARGTVSSPETAERVLPSYTFAAASYRSTGDLAERMLPDVPVPSPAQALLAQRESAARWGLLEDFGAYTSEEIADLRSRAKNRHALANRWRSEGKVFSVELRGQSLYPGFQFDSETHAPKPVVAEVLTFLPREQMSDWEVALWWTAANDWLEWRRPVDQIDEDPEGLSAAAARLAEPSSL